MVAPKKKGKLLAIQILIVIVILVAIYFMGKAAKDEIGNLSYHDSSGAKHDVFNK